MVPTIVVNHPIGGMAIAIATVAALSTPLSWVATRAVRSHAIRNAMIDVPNQRSSHSIATPRGGGAAIVVVVLLATSLCALLGWLPGRMTMALGGGGALVAAVGWLDDRHNVSAGIRAFAHLSAAVWAVSCIGGFGGMQLGVLGTIPGWLANFVAVLCIAWMTNLYNFMDGIDGIASAETIVVGITGSILLLLSGAAGLALVCASLVGASAGFLIWNRMPARIFMGDVGSGFIGFVLATIAISAQTSVGLPILLWVLLLLVFIADATTTLMRRFIHGEPWHLAHRLHAYQRLVQSGLSHAEVVVRVSLLNVCLGVLAWITFVRPHWVWLTLLAGLMLVGIAYIAVERRLGMWHVTARPDAGVTNSAR